MEEYFYFGESGRQLFGACHYPKKRTQYSDTGILICAPLLHDYTRTYWALRTLANTLASKGHYVLRFDYYATGDSAGDSKLGTISSWTTNISDAAEELINLSGCRYISIIAVRLAAILLPQTQLDQFRVKHLLFWEPVIKGSDYLRVSEELHEQTRRHEDYSPQPRTQNVSGSHREILGFILPGSLYEQIDGYNMLHTPPIKTEKLTLLVDKESAMQQQLCNSYLKLKIPAEIVVADDTLGFDHFNKLARALTPAQTLTSIAEIISEV